MNEQHSAGSSKDVLEVLQAGIDDAGDMVKEFGALSSINVSAEWLLNACVLAHAEITRLRPGNETIAVDRRTTDEKFAELKGQCQSLWRTDITLVCRLPSGHSGDHRADNNWTWNGNGCDVRDAPNGGPAHG